MTSSQEETVPTPPLRGTRTKKPSLKALESLYITKLKNSGFVANISSDEDHHYFTSSSEESGSEEVPGEACKPKLLHNNEQVHGEEIFQFHKRKQRGSLALKAAEVCASSTSKTPFKIRNKLKKQLAAKILEDVSSGSDYEESSAEESSSSDDESQEESEDSEPAPVKKNLNLKIQNNVGARGRRKVNTNYCFNADEYFSNNASKATTSNNTLDKLENPRLPQYKLQELLAKMKLSKPHQNAVQNLTQTNRNNFQKWLYLLHENFNILLYGLGSKKSILTDFQNEFLNGSPVLVVNGFFPTLSIKSILDSIIEDLLELKENSFNVFEACDLIEQQFNHQPSNHLYIIIHNIEGDMLCNVKSQSVFARLASIKNIHLIASIDHINAPLIWDHNKLAKLNFMWWDVTSYLPYLEETSFECSLMVQKSGNLALSSLQNVFLSLTSNSKSIYMLIVKHQLENVKNQYYQGLAFKDLYLACREEFIVSSDLALRAQLTEFIDHKLVKLKRSVDGTEYLLIPLSNALLQKFCDDQNS